MLASLARGATLLCAAPRTGRTHQIRVHATVAGHPLVGDDLYGALLPWAPRQLLHAATLDLVHPVTGAHLSLAAPLPDDFLAALGVVGLSVPADLPAHLPAMDGWGPDPPC
jgi:23S rRNA pseudouridine1911/1915/1917 synthase